MESTTRKIYYKSLNTIYIILTIKSQLLCVDKVQKTLCGLESDELFPPHHRFPIYDTSEASR